jgi:hypothetical protein
LWIDDLLRFETDSSLVAPIGIPLPEGDATMTNMATINNDHGDVDMSMLFLDLASDLIATSSTTATPTSALASSHFPNSAPTTLDSFDAIFAAAGPIDDLTTFVYGC